MNISKEEFKVMLMLYASHIDGSILQEEIEEILNRTDGETYRKVSKQFRGMSDADVLDCIRENKDKYAASEEEQQMLIADIKAVISADSRKSAIESQLLNTLTKIIKY